MEQVSERPFTHTAIAPRVSQDYPTQRWFHGTGGVCSNLYAADRTSYADVYRDGTKDVAEVRLARYTPGAQFMAASGFDYAAPVPEPREGAMVAAGVVWCLGGWGLHRRRQR